MTGERAKRRPQVTVPSAGEERLKLGRIGVVVSICFAIGVCWPFLAGVKLVPDAPVDEVTHEKQPEKKPKPEAQSEVGEDEPHRTEAETVEIDKPIVIHCLDKHGKRHKDCDVPNLDSVVQARLQTLANCKGAEDLSGKLSVGFKVDFKAKKINDLVQGKSTTIKKSLANQLLKCGEKEFASASLGDVDHEYENYLLFYLVKFVPPGTPIAESAAKTETVTPANGSATVVFESAMIHADADEDSEVRARLLYGTRVFITGRLGEWYEVKYDAKGRKGWVHQNAIGMK